MKTLFADKEALEAAVARQVGGIDEGDSPPARRYFDTHFGGLIEIFESDQECRKWRGESAVIKNKLDRLAVERMPNRYSEIEPADHKLNSAEVAERTRHFIEAMRARGIELALSPVGTK